MKIKRTLSAAAALVILAGVLTGCSASLKTARVASKFGSALKEQPITSASAEINCSLSVDHQGVHTENRFHSVVRSKTDWEENRSYSDIDTTFNVLDQNVAETMQCYSSGESGEEVRYVHVDGPDVWVRLEDQIRAVDIDPGLILLLLDKVSQETTLEMAENAAGGGSHHIINLCFAAQDIKDFAEKAGITIPAEFADCDLSDVTIPVQLEIEDKTFLPLRLQVEIKGINNSLIQALARAFAKGRDVQGAQVEMDELSLLITNFAYGPQDIPLLPKGAAEKALDMKKIKEIQN